MRNRLLLAAALCCAGTAAQAHHSFAVFFDDTKDIKIKGKVTGFRFTNPHGLITLDVTDAKGTVTPWRVETNAPVVLVRRGWTRDILKAGDVITIEGWPSRDGKPYARLRAASDSSGKPIGKSAFGKTDS
ncbi:MAG: DUF6152 family protein [Croceibacterium sp.]